MTMKGESSESVQNAEAAIPAHPKRQSMTLESGKNDENKGVSSTGENCEGVNFNMSFTLTHFKKLNTHNTVVSGFFESHLVYQVFKI